MPHVVPTGNPIHIARRYALERARKKIQPALARTGSLIFKCGGSLIASLESVARAYQMAYVDPYRPPRHGDD